ncbi:ABC-2 family transporter protein [Clostridium sp. YIM B02515]|uniref:ABC-2 family transporter protein n=1 Tax=Clostridium rhizosphaerae TaxID=2803861 RepID=A0ABS1T9M3_9CLOT|nr:ABC-2 family transporter protein [Clostridium rhizosphaerae]MBL4936039.1 ABC-2 family transporter protein [Clostridium rhizosphaerae]
MTYMKRKLRLYWPFSRGVIQSIMSYRVNFFMFVFGNLMRTFVVYYLWKAVFISSGSGTINGFSLNDMIIYIFMSSLTAGTIATGTDSDIGHEVMDGSIAMNLIKPISYKVRMLFMSFGSLLYQFIFILLPVWIGLIAVRYFTAGELPPDAKTIVLYLLSLMLGFFVNFLMNFSFGLLAFYVTNMWGIGHLKDAALLFFSGQLIPIAFFPELLQKIMQFFPFSSLNYIPVMIYLKKLTGMALVQALGIQLLWIALLYLLSLWFWNRATNKLVILGG